MPSQVYIFYQQGTIEGIPGVFPAGSQVTIDTLTMTVSSIVPLPTPITPASTTTISPTGIVASINPASKTTNYALVPGTLAGQNLYVINESNYNATFSASGSSNVADGVNDSIAPKMAGHYIWDTSTSLWYRIGSRYGVFINVKDYGAVGDGSNDDSQAITDAITMANTLGGGTVYFPRGTYISGTQTLYSKIRLLGDGPEISILKLKSGTNADLLQGQNAPSLINISAAYGTSSTGGINLWALENITFDGNKSGQTGGPSYPIRIYGYAFRTFNITVRNGYSGGWQNDWNGGATMADSTDQMEAEISHLKIHDNAGIGLQLAGPHDTQIQQIDSFLNDSHGIHIAPNATGTQVSNFHIWGCKQSVSAVSLLCEAGGCMFTNPAIEGSDTMNVAILANNFSLTGGHIFGPSALQSVANGIQIGQLAGNTPYPNQVLQSAGTTTAVAPSGLNIFTKISSCGSTNGGIWFANDGGANNITANIFQTAGNYTTGSPSAADNLHIIGSGLTADGSRGKGGIIQFAVNANAALKLTTTGTDVMALNSFSGTKRMDFPNGTIFRQYSDNYTTRTVEISGGTISVLQSTSASAVSNNGTITTSSVGIARVNPAANVTGIILQSGTNVGQRVIVRNESAFTVTFDVSGTSHVADGATSAIPANCSREFEWSGSFWYRIA